MQVCDNSSDPISLEGESDQQPPAQARFSTSSEHNEDDPLGQSNMEDN